jgi:aconitase A
MFVSHDQTGIGQQRDVGMNAAIVAGQRFGQGANRDRAELA